MIHKKRSNESNSGHDKVYIVISTFKIDISNDTALFSIKFDVEIFLQYCCQESPFSTLRCKKIRQNER